MRRIASVAHSAQCGSADSVVRVMNELDGKRHFRVL